MLDKIQAWLNELEIKANENKKAAKLDGKKYIWYSTQKNKDIKRKFSTEGEKLPASGTRLSSRSSGDSSGGEWLYDFVLREFDESNRLIGIRLAVEIELSDSKPGGLVYDFNKLLQSDAPYKGFIFQQKDDLSFSEILEHLEAALDRYTHRLDSEFLISCWITSKYQFICKQYVVESGRITRRSSKDAVNGAA